MGTTAAETLAVAGNIFVGMVSTLEPSVFLISQELRAWQRTNLERGFSLSCPSQPPSFLFF
jgi:hypothetical protein